MKGKDRRSRKRKAIEEECDRRRMQRRSTGSHALTGVKGSSVAYHHSRPKALSSPPPAPYPQHCHPSRYARTQHWVISTPNQRECHNALAIAACYEQEHKNTKPVSYSYSMLFILVFHHNKGDKEGWQGTEGKGWIANQNRVSMGWEKRTC